MTAMKDKVVIVTGAKDGIGLETAQLFAKAEEVASVVLWLCSSSASYVVGQAISVDGGYTVQ